MKTEKALVGVLAGMAAGALLGVLFAPEKGSKTRKKIVKKSKNTIEDLKQKMEDLMGKFNKKLEEGEASSEAKIS